MILEGASAYATVVGLISAFSSGRQSDKAAEITDFMLWLIDHNHQELVDVIKQNQTASIGIKSLLNQTASDLNSKLDYLGETLGQLSKRIPDFDKLTESLLPGIELSDQAFEILEGMHEGGVEFVILNKTMNAPPTLLANTNAHFEIKDPRFLNDDLSVLTNLGLLNLEYGSSGNEMYYYTRVAHKLISNSFN